MPDRPEAVTTSTTTSSRIGPSACPASQGSLAHGMRKTVVRTSRMVRSGMDNPLVSFARHPDLSQLIFKAIPPDTSSRQTFRIAPLRDYGRWVLLQRGKRILWRIVPTPETVRVEAILDQLEKRVGRFHAVRHVGEAVVAYRNISGRLVARVELTGRHQL